MGLPSPPPSLVQEPTGRVVYFHSKGASYRMDNRFALYDHWWRKFMEHFAIDLHHAILTHDLSDASPHVAAGVKFRGPNQTHDPYPQPHYSGNFWLAKCTYINTLPQFTPDFTLNMFNSEFWIGMGPGFMDHYRDCWSPREGECSSTYTCMIPEDSYKDFKTCGRPPLQQ